MAETQFPSEATVLAALIHQHKMIGDDPLLTLIEAEMEAAAQMHDIDAPETDPFPNPSVIELLACIEDATAGFYHGEDTTKERRRYLRLRFFEANDVFDDGPSRPETESLPVSGLSDDELLYLHELDIDAIHTASEVYKRGIQP